MTNRLAFAHFCSTARRKGALALCLALCTLGLGLSGSAREPKFTTIDPTDSVYTSLMDINPAGAVTGLYQDAEGLYHGFMRAPDGTITTFEDPYAGTGNYQGTWPYSINPAGEITGFYFDTNSVSHGFLLAPDLTTFTEIDAPGACSSGPSCSYEGTFPESINPEGAVAGYYLDAGGVFHGFVRAPHGAITTFDAPGACSSGPSCSMRAPSPVSINPEGAIAGYYLDASDVSHGFVRALDGRITTFDAPGAGSSGRYAPIRAPCPTASTRRGTITGYYIDANNVYHGFLRDTSAGSRRSTHRARVAADLHATMWAPSPRASTRRGRSRDVTLTRTTWPTASCAIYSAASPRSTIRTLALTRALAPCP